jgi:hypothetical protein
MPWGWILSVFLVVAGLLLLAAALFHVRVRAGWGGAWESLDSKQEGSFRVEYGFPGFMREWAWDEDRADEGRGMGDGGEPQTRTQPSRATETNGPAGMGDPAKGDPWVAPADPPSSPPSSIPRPSPRKRRRGLRPRWRRALFRFVTDGKTWKLLARHGFRTARGAIALLRPRVAIAVGHPDPVKLARLAGYWHASAPLLSASRASLELRFQDRRPTFAIRAEGGFSALSFILFGIRNVSSFPWIGLGRRVWHGWWRHELEGWRKWAYRKIQE